MLFSAEQPPRHINVDRAYILQLHCTHVYCLDSLELPSPVASLPLSQKTPIRQGKSRKSANHGEAPGAPVNVNTMIPSMPFENIIL